MSGHYRDDPAVHEEAARAGVESLRNYCGDNLERARASQASGTESRPGVDLEKIAADDAAAVERMEREARRYPAYLSVAVFVDEVPPDDVMQEFRERAALFAAERRHLRLREQVGGAALAVEGFRVIEPVP